MPVDLLEQAAVAAVQAVIDAAGLDDDHGFYASPAHSCGDQAAAIDAAIREVVAPSVERVLPGYQIIFCAVTSKGRTHGAEVKFHHDWTYSDERVHRARFLWCPLVDTTTDNGGMSVVPGSHRWHDGIRAGRPMDRPVVTEPHQREFAARSVPLAVQAGHALLFDPAMLHGSAPNATDRPRPAITIATVPAEATLVHFHEDDAGRVTGAVVPRSFFTRHPYGEAPVGYPVVEPWAPLVDEATFEAALAAQD